MKLSLKIAAAVLAAGLAGPPLLGAIQSESAQSGPSPADLALINGVIQLVQRDYVHPVGSDELTRDALKGMLTRLDPHSDYMDEQEFRQSQADLSGRFGGLGIQISQQSGVPVVIAPIEDTPAARAGIQPSDLIVAIDGQSTAGMDMDAVVRSLRGDPGTSVTVTISRGKNEPFDVTMTRSIIQVATVKSKLEADQVGYVRITQFGGDTAKDFKQALVDLKKQAGGQLKGVVLDLRNDPGGLLAAAVAVSGDFLDGGTVVSIRGRHAGDDEAFDAPREGDMVPNTPVVVLINGASASASEIVAGALQDRQRAKVMGTQSFGKGSVQTLVPLKGHGALRLTTALYYTPAGRSIQDQGITPDMVVEAPKDQQVAGAVMLREAALKGAFQNPGSLGGGRNAQPPRPAGSGAPGAKAEYSAPIKLEVIGTQDDAQLKEALSYLGRQANGG